MLRGVLRWIRAYIGGCTAEEVGADIFYDGKPRSVRWLLGQLWHCSDIMASDLCDDLGMPSGSTYARAAQELMSELIGS